MRRVSSTRLGHLNDLLMEFGDREWFSFDFIETNGIDQVSATNESSELAHIEFRNQYLLVARDDFTKVAWERIEVPNMS